ncbi:hypothetical protein NA56DRAFT_751120 [Hyaloscypha hepaticicola]|uniref:Uncharacterized protein n=1 Tax=Hyaloscypha hepaticicola TaxID=2082293 RepID=A0A2J6PXW7_9HELO|nr:hypothetical protein NA56DRAFT_751120 [Hyaloscypha hepaticicola]
MRDSGPAGLARGLVEEDRRGMRLETGVQKYLFRGLSGHLSTPAVHIHAEGLKVPCGTCRVLGAAGGPVSSLPRMSKRLSTGSAGVRVRHELLVITRCQPDPSPLLGAAGAPREGCGCRVPLPSVGFTGDRQSQACVSSMALCYPRKEHGAGEMAAVKGPTRFTEYKIALVMILVLGLLVTAHIIGSDRLHELLPFPELAAGCLMMVVLSSHLLATPLQQLAAQVSRRSGTTRPSNLASSCRKRNRIYVPDPPNPWRRHALRIGDRPWARYGVVKMDIILSRNSPPLERILDFGIAQVAESWLELVLPSSAKSSRCRVLARGYEKSPTWSEVAWMCEYHGTRT